MTFSSRYFGSICVDESSVIEFPAGMPGFEECRRFLPLQDAAREGLIFLQSLEDPELCFLALSVAGVRPGYRLMMRPEDLDLLGLPGGAQPVIGKDVAAVAIVSLVEGEDPTVNLLSPVVIDIQTRRAVQAIRPDTMYGCREPVSLPQSAEEAAQCS